MSLALREPNLLDFALCAANLIEEDRRQWTEFTGLPYDANRVAAECWGYVGPRWAIYDALDSSAMPLAVAGLRVMRMGVYQSWFLSGNELWTPRYGDSVTQVTKQTIQDMLSAGGAHRIETICLESRHKTRGWYQRVGLHFEAVLARYGVKGENAVQYAVYRRPAEKQ